MLQLLALLHHSKKVQGSRLSWGWNWVKIWLRQVFSVWSLHVLCVCAGSLRLFFFLPQSKDMQIRLIGISKLGMSLIGCLCQLCDELVTCPRYDLLFAKCQLGSAAVTPPLQPCKGEVITENKIDIF